MVLNYMEEIYKNPLILEYLRFHPRWYKILHYDPEMLPVFMNEAKEKLKIRTVDKLENIKTQVTFISSMADFLIK